MSSPQIHIKTIGSGNQALLCLHGWGMTHHYWSHAQEELKDELDKIRLIFVDLPGHGESPFPKSESDYFAYTIQQLLELVDHLNTPRISVLGHSMGSLLALLLADTLPAKINHLILDSSPLFGLGSLKRSLVGELIAMHPLVGYPLLYAMKWPLWTKRFFIPKTVSKIENLGQDDYKILLDGLTGAHCRVMHLANLGIRKFDGTKKIENLVPTYIFGERDAIIKPDFIIERLKEIDIESTTRIKTFPDTGHCVQMEKPAEYFAAIREILGIGRE